MQKITPFLWFDNNAEEAVNFYASIFRNSKVGSIVRYDEPSAKTSGMPKGTAMTVPFQLEGQEFTALNGGPVFKFTEAISFVVHCESQQEVDHYWEKLSAGGDEKAQQCGWLKDKYGVSWQIVPGVLIKLLQDKDAGKSKRVMVAMLQMKKIDINKLQHGRSEVNIRPPLDQSDFNDMHRNQVRSLNVDSSSADYSHEQSKEKTVWQKRSFKRSCSRTRAENAVRPLYGCEKAFHDIGRPRVDFVEDWEFLFSPSWIYYREDSASREGQADRANMERIQLEQE